MKYYIIAGEASGDLHAANLIKSLKHEDANTSIHAWGGDRMKAQGATIVKHYRDLAFGRPQNHGTSGFYFKTNVEVRRNFRCVSSRITPRNILGQKN